MRFAPAAGVLVFLAIGALRTVLDYRDALAEHAWTAASIGLGLGILASLIGAAIGGMIGAYARKAQERGDRARARVVAALGAALAAFLGARAVVAHRERAYLQSVRSDVLTEERARALMSGSREERLALGYNRSCPPDLLAVLGRDPDWAIRATAGGNPSTPRATLDALSRDGNESVRLYVSLNPAVKK